MPTVQPGAGRPMRAILCAAAMSLALPACGCATAASAADRPSAIAPPVRIAIWDSGVDLSLFAGRLALDADGKPMVRGYNAFKLREDTPLAVLPDALERRRDALLEDLVALDDLDAGIDSPMAKAIDARLKAMSKQEQAAFDEDIGRISGYAHGTN